MRQNIQRAQHLYFIYRSQKYNYFLEKFDEKIEQKLKDSEHKYSEPLEESKEATKEANQFIHKQLTGNQ